MEAGAVAQLTAVRCRPTARLHVHFTGGSTLSLVELKPAQASSSPHTASDSPSTSAPSCAHRVQWGVLRGPLRQLASATQPLFSALRDAVRPPQISPI
jgi:hypothetical protein